MTAAPLPTPSIADIERWGRLKMPAAAQDVQAYVDTGGLDALVLLTFRLPASDLPSFLAGAGYAAPLQPPRQGYEFSVTYFYGFHEKLPRRESGRGLSWWPSNSDWDRILQDPDRVLLSGGRSEPGYGRNILVDETDAGVCTVYLVHSEL
jgi:hypothetical protein